MVAVESRVDVALVGAGIMSLTLATLLRELEPKWKIVVIESLDGVAKESSYGWNNAGTGHSALCELNYTPEQPDGSLAIDKAVQINQQFQVSRQFWAWLVETGGIPDPSLFIRRSPHISLVFGEKNVSFLRTRYEALKANPLFSSMEYSDDPAKIGTWAPLTIDGRLKGEPIAATRVAEGTDVDFGVLTQLLTERLKDKGVDFLFEKRVTNLKKKDGGWELRVRDSIGATPSTIVADFVFVGAGGAALPLLQKSGIKEIRGYGGFPVSGEWLKCDNPDVVSQHTAKVYGMAELGAPPMSVPHLDARIVEGQHSLLFGPYAGFKPKFLKNGSWFDLFASLRWHNLLPMVSVGIRELGLLRYLVSEVFASRGKRLEALYRFYPDANPEDWEPEVAGQRVQVIKPDPEKIGVLQFGTEVVASEDGSIAGLLGASPGASTATAIMIAVLERCFPEHIADWEKPLTQIIPTYRSNHSADDSDYARQLKSTAKILKI
jgi:malate dehydrogenase (quinone)